MKNLLSIILFFISFTGFSKGVIKVTTAYGTHGLSSDVVENVSFAGLLMSASYMVAPKVYKNMNLHAGLSYFAGSPAWTKSEIERVGFANELTLDLKADYPAKSFIAYGGFRIPIMSNLVMGGDLSVVTSQGLLESSSETHYKGSGFEMFLGGSVPMGSFKVFSVGMISDLGLEIGSVSRTYSVDKTLVVSTFSDFEGSHPYNIAMSGVSFRLAANFTIK